MLTRAQAKKSAITIIAHPLPQSSRRKARRRDRGEDNIEPANVEDILEEALVDVPKKIARVPKELPIKWKSFIRKLFDSEPTNLQYAVSCKIWEYILSKANSIVPFWPNSNVILVRDFRGGTPSKQVIDAISNPNKVRIRTNHSKYGIVDRLVYSYLIQESFEEAVKCLQRDGWGGDMHDPNNYDDEPVWLL